MGGNDMSELRRVYRYEVFDADDGDRGIRAVPITQEEFDALTARAAAAESSLEATRGALERIVAMGCEDQDLADDERLCSDRYPDDPQEWCRTCIARSALAPTPEEN